MTKVMIIDDELIICQLINRLIDREALDIDICASVSSSEEAYRLSLDIKPDIIITDINMPVMNGLELIKNLTDAGLETTYIIISGYQSFDYAYTAIKYGVTDFLLKPIDRGELNGTLKRIIDKKTAVEHTLHHLEAMDRLTQNSRQSMRQNLLLSLTYPQSAPSDNSKIQDADAFDFSGDIFLIGLLQLDLHAEVSRLANQIVTAISEYIENALRPICRELETVRLADSLVFLLNFSSGQDANIQTQLSNVLSFAAERVREYHLCVTIGLSDEFGDANGLYAGYREALCAVRSRYVLGRNRMIRARDCNIRQAAPFYDMAALKPTISQCVEILDLQGAEEALSRLTRAMHSYLADYPYNTQSLYVRIAHELIAIVNGFRKGADESSTDARTVKKSFERCGTLDDFDKALGQCFQSVYSAFSEESQRSQSQSIAFVKRYISEHYAEPLTLETLAGRVHLNTAYLGILFKKNEGVNYLDYFVNVRIEKAKELLKSTPDSIQTVANSVGYSDVRYFSKLFLKIVGIKPSEYRRIHSY